MAAAAGAGAAAGAATLAAGWPYLGSAPAIAVVNVLIAGGLTGAGVLMLPAGPLRGCGRPLVGAGLAWLATWAMSWNTGIGPVLGIAGNCVFYVLFCLALLRYPQGRLAGRADRVLVTATAVALGPVMALSVVTSRPEWNGYAADAWWPGWLAHRSVFGALSDGFQVIIPLLAVGFAVLLSRRVRGLRGPERVVAPLVLSMVGGAIVTVAVLTPPIEVDGLDGVMRGIAMQSIVLAVFPVVLVVAAARRALGVVTAADRVLRLTDPATVRSVRDALRTVLRDPTVEIWFRLPDLPGYVDVDGRPADLDLTDLDLTDRDPADLDLAEVGGRGLAAAPRWAREVRTGDGAVLAVVTGDPALGTDNAYTEAALRAGQLALENAQLQAAARARLVEVHAAHRQVAGAQAAQRRRMAADLHDGMQRRLMELVLVAADAQARPADPAGTRTVLRQLHEGLLAANQEVRDLGRGLGPGEAAAGPPRTPGPG
ncbi:sensor histidine kinase [Parafrankia elaeagni]|uniref:histidine kinase dimerization/phosphoacceptor domain-containing protein n=1 Tax=Parafrankia elaeagni TaxID=222534 RepID=UPI00039E83B3|nr:histidine kinase dimerization/phosphoacceptor domain-containing protein [Parafrankia elaeagni]